ncbi:glucosylceramidase [Sphingomonas naasensis]|uniref:Glycosyl hydrolase n=1 Tax=Sphingomonas naasensis TaxID=1344951 RepID=A0A4S1WMH1_9SPHN|nr:glycoside hydrolase family 30 beta sandwich domain-containing protein [Sphingomonas naasensis]NIJ20362.1 glucosylceramidase [Sphingomonas naasensis]TGX44474.1 glycosyl hydrolase [Sphingomonas naasensis]
MRLWAGLCALALAGCAPAARPTAVAPAPGTVEIWLTLPDQSVLLARQPSLALAPGPAAGAINVDPAQRFQEMVGYGAAITDASAWLIQRHMTPAQREALLADLFGPEGIALSFTRVTIGASDFSRSHYSYDDRPKGERDPELAHFSIAPARAEVLPTVRAARAINPQLAVMVSPWSAPGWMKTTDALIKGTLRDDAYRPFAAYMRRTVQGFAAEIGPVDYLSIQNEPDFEPENYPGMRLSPAQRAKAIALLGPELARAGLKTRILDWDHNWDLPEQPLGVLADPAAARYVSGVAWHCYKGDVAAQSVVRDKHPDKDVFFTECSGGEWSKAWPDSWAWTMRNLVIGAPRHWARGVLMWNLALDEKYGPHLGGCDNCRGVVKIDSTTGGVTRNVEYYAFGHASKFVARGAHRIASDSRPGGIETVAFANPDGSRVLLVFNAGAANETVTVAADGGHFAYALPSNAAVTFRWRGAR